MIQHMRNFETPYHTYYTTYESKLGIILQNNTHHIVVE